MQNAKRHATAKNNAKNANCQTPNAMASYPDLNGHIVNNTYTYSLYQKFVEKERMNYNSPNSLNCERMEGYVADIAASFAHNF